MLYQISEGLQFKKMLPGRSLVNDLMLQDPGEVMRDKDSVETGSERRIDVGAGAITDHPGTGGVAAVMLSQDEIGLRVFFGQDLNGSEVGGEARTVKLAGLLFEISFSDHNEPVPGREISKCIGHTGEKLDLLIGDGLSKALDALMFFRCERGVGKLLETGDQRMTKAVETVTVIADGRVFDAIEVFSDLFRCVNAMVEIGDETGDSPLEVDIVLPQGIVGVEEQCLRRGAAD